jgi:hypothetical protein
MSNQRSIVSVMLVQRRGACSPSAAVQRRGYGGQGAAGEECVTCPLYFHHKHPTLALPNERGRDDARVTLPTE